MTDNERRIPTCNLTTPFLWVLFTVALSLSGAFQVQADTPCYLCEKMGKLKPSSVSPDIDASRSNNSCALLATYVRQERHDLIPEFVEGCSNHKDKEICEATRDMLQGYKIEFTCKGGK